MKLHLPSFLIGASMGATGAVIAPRLRPLALEIATVFYRIGDTAMVRIARAREDFTDLLAEAKARARQRVREPLRSVS
ncbi:MAG: hypothetical protein JWO36_1077 [Myxococcales bacterium]|nr:hypothetical protein [Myxococcales bacterium]